MSFFRSYAQGQKGVTDVGAQSCAADAHLILRPHEEDGAVVVDGVVRSWAWVPATCVRWAFPTGVPAPDLELCRLLGDVRALAGNAVLQWQALTDGACALLGADKGFLSEFHDFLPGRVAHEVGTVPTTHVDPAVVPFIGKWYAERAVDQDAMGAAPVRGRRDARGQRFSRACRSGVASMRGLPRSALSDPVW